MSKVVHIAGRAVGAGEPCYIIAEAGVNHNGDIGMALELIDVASETGADAVKFQSLTADLLTSPQAPKASYQLETVGEEGSQADMIRALEMGREDHEKMIEHAGKRGITFFSTPFDPVNADMLEELGAVVFKTGSGEVNNWPHLRHIARKGKPIIFSTGMSYLGEVDAAIRVMQAEGADEIILMHCVSQYPAPIDQSNLRAMQTMARAFDRPTGHSDHSIGIEVPLAATAMGAVAIEKHVTLGKTLPGPDHKASADPDEFRLIVRGIRAVESSLGNGIKEPQAAEKETRAIVRRSIAASVPIPKGTVLGLEHLKMVRPGGFIPPDLIDYVVGRETTTDIPVEQFLAWSNLR